MNNKEALPIEQSAEDANDLASPEVNAPQSQAPGLLMEAVLDALPEVDAAELAAAATVASLPAFMLPGQLLAERREELRWSLEEAAEKLKLTPRQVSSLEANDFPSLPGMASVRGFVRSYAKILGLDPQHLLDLLANEPNPAHGPMVLRRPLPTNGFPGRRSSPPPRRSKWRRRIGFTLVFATVIAALGVEAYRSQWIAESDVASLSGAISMPLFSRLNADTLLRSAPEPATATATEADKEVAGSGADSAAKPAATPVAAPAPAPAPALELKFHEDAWVEITTMSGQIIVSRLMKAGTKEVFDMTEPAILVVGNAAAVDARLRGQLLNLKAVARDNVSKLSLK